MLDIAVIDEGWNARLDFERAVEAAVAATPFVNLATSPASIEIAIRLTSDTEVHALNLKWRDKDQPTNVLSFPMCDADELATLEEAQGEVMLGDIVLAQGVCTREAEEKRIPLEAHATHLIVHGVLHLLGYDHMGDEEALAMESLERRVLAGLDLHDPYADELA